MEAGRKQLEQLVQMNFLHQAASSASSSSSLTQHPAEMGKTILEQLQMTKETFNQSSVQLRNVNIKKKFKTQMTIKQHKGLF